MSPSISFHMILWFTLIPAIRGLAQTSNMDPQQLCPVDQIPSYNAQFVSQPPIIDGKLDENIWSTAEKSSAFRDLVNGTTTQHDTKVSVLWDDTNLYVGYWIEEPNVTATFTEQDAPIYRDNDVELFIAGRDGYYELEINAHATIYEVLFIWESAFEKYGYSTRKEFDRNAPLVKTFNGVGYKSHPRGKRIGFWNWDYPGLKKAVHVDGTLNNNNDVDRGWTVELALSWKGFEALAKLENRSLPPRNMDVWRMDFSRFNTYKDKASGTDSGGWAWSPHGVWDSHIPECFTFIQFVKQ